MSNIQFKDAAFYTSFFKDVDGIRLIDEFVDSSDRSEKSLFVGTIEVVNSIHELIVRVEIPKDFPYGKLMFRTKSLKGYPHLIYNGKIEHGSWFCLNTPFAETAEEQLKQEVFRLKEWCARQLRSELPAIIDDENVVAALRFANAYDWENVDEMNEFSLKAPLTFVGDFHKKSGNFNAEQGHLLCVKTEDNRYYALSPDTATQIGLSAKLPYIIVDKLPTSEETLQDFLKMAEFYGWDGETCKHLLPDINLDTGWTKYGQNGSITQIDEARALSLINEAMSELEKPDTYIPGEVKNLTNNGDIIVPRKKMKPIRVQDEIKPLLIKELERIKEETVSDHGYNFFKSLNSSFDSPEEWEEIEWEMSQANLYHYFALGITDGEDNLSWRLVYTTQNGGDYESVIYDLKIGEFSVRRLISYNIAFLPVQEVTRNMFFGRGAFSTKFLGKKIAIVGLGAIGSMVAESLSRSGVNVVGLWDTDVVEPGNICRSAYTLSDMGESKIYATRKRMLSVNPFVSVEEIHGGGHWLYSYENANDVKFVGGSFYGNVNYLNQEEAIKEIQEYDIIIDCTASNEMLHFLSYALPNKRILSLCITNHAENLLCVTSRDGNPFELRKAYLSRIEQDTKNFYLEGSGCYSPTFLATHSDISALVGLTLKELNCSIEQEQIPHTCIFSYDQRGILKDVVRSYRLKGYDIILTACSESLLDAEDITMESSESTIGYILGAYSSDKKSIMITHIVDSMSAGTKLTDAFRTSQGIIDYIGDYVFSGETPHTYTDESAFQIAEKADDESINTCNPILGIWNADGTIDFFLQINGGLVPFEEIKN